MLGSSASLEGVAIDEQSLALRSGRLEAIDTMRLDFGGTYQEIIRDTLIPTGRVAATLQRHDHLFGSIEERDRL